MNIYDSGASLGMLISQSSYGKPLFWMALGTVIGFLPILLNITNTETRSYFAIFVLSASINALIVSGYDTAVNVQHVQWAFISVILFAVWRGAVWLKAKVIYQMTRHHT